MSLRRTACSACSSAKRRCDSGVPACSRCTKQSLECTYRYPPVDAPPLAARAEQTEDLWQSLPLPQAAIFDDATSGWLLTPGYSVPAASTSGVDPPYNGPISDSNVDWSWLPAAGEAWDMQLSTAVLDPYLQSSTSYSLIDPVGSFIPSDDPFPSQELPWETHPSAPSSQDLSITKTTTNNSPRHRRSKKRQRQHSPVQSSKVPRLVSHEPWLRGADKETWLFCARELLSFAEMFAKDASTYYIIRPQDFEHRGKLLDTSLQRALGVCAARKSLGESHQPVFEQMLDNEASQLIDSSTSPGSVETWPALVTFNGEGFYDLLISFRRDLARLQAMVLYQTMRLFGPSNRERRLGEESEPLMASWTREILIKTQILDMLYQRSPRSPSFVSSPVGAAFNGSRASFPSSNTTADDSSSVMPLHTDEIKCAYRTALTSYMIRSVYAALVYEVCHLLSEIAHLPVHICEKDLADESALDIHRKHFGNEGVPYGELVDAWAMNKMAPLTKYDQFTVLLVVACKGLDVLPYSSRHSPNSGLELGSE